MLPTLAARGLAARGHQGFYRGCARAGSLRPSTHDVKITWLFLGGVDPLTPAGTQTATRGSSLSRSPTALVAHRDEGAAGAGAEEVGRKECGSGRGEDGQPVEVEGGVQADAEESGRRKDDRFGAARDRLDNACERSLRPPSYPRPGGS